MEILEEIELAEPKEKKGSNKRKDCWEQGNGKARAEMARAEETTIRRLQICARSTMGNITGRTAQIIREAIISAEVQIKTAGNCQPSGQDQNDQGGNQSNQNRSEQHNKSNKILCQGKMKRLSQRVCFEDSSLGSDLRDSDLEKSRTIQGILKNKKRKKRRISGLY